MGNMINYRLYTRQYNGENYLLCNGASPIVKTIICEHCKGSGMEVDEETDAVSLCQVCEGYGELEEWR